MRSSTSTATPATSSTWRNIYDGNDNLLSSRVEADSHYDVGNKIILVAPGCLPDTGE